MQIQALISSIFHLSQWWCWLSADSEDTWHKLQQPAHHNQRELDPAEGTGPGAPLDPGATEYQQVTCWEHFSVLLLPIPFPDFQFWAPVLLRKQLTVILQEESKNWRCVLLSQVRRAGGARNKRLETRAACLWMITNKGLDSGTQHWSHGNDVALVFSGLLMCDSAHLLSWASVEKISYISDIKNLEQVNEYGPEILMFLESWKWALWWQSVHHLY